MSAEGDCPRWPQRWLVIAVVWSTIHSNTVSDSGHAESFSSRSCWPLTTDWTAAGWVRSDWPVRHYASAGISRHRVYELSVCLSHAGIVSKRLNIGSRTQRQLRDAHSRWWTTPISPEVCAQSDPPSTLYDPLRSKWPTLSTCLCGRMVNPLSRHVQ